MIGAVEAMGKQEPNGGLTARTVKTKVGAGKHQPYKLRYLNRILSTDADITIYSKLESYFGLTADVGLNADIELGIQFEE